MPRPYTRFQTGKFGRTGLTKDCPPADVHTSATCEMGSSNFNGMHREKNILHPRSFREGELLRR